MTPEHNLQETLDLVRWASRPDAVAMTTDGVNALLDRIHELRSALAALREASWFAGMYDVYIRSAIAIADAALSSEAP